MGGGKAIEINAETGARKPERKTAAHGETRKEPGTRSPETGKKNGDARRDPRSTPPAFGEATAGRMPGQAAHGETRSLRPG